MLEATYQFLVERRQRVYDQAPTKKHIERVAKWITGQSYKRGLLLYGNIGSGKTTLADALLRLIRIKKATAKIYRKTAIEIADFAKSDIDKYQEITRCEMLFIDDMGEEPFFVKNYGNEVSPLVELLYYRYDRLLFTVITTNKLENEISDIYGPRIADRIEEMFDKIYFNNGSFRSKK